MRRRQEGRGAEVAQLRQQLEASQRKEASAAADAEQQAAGRRVQEEGELAALRQQLARAQRAQRDAEAALAAERQQVVALEEAILSLTTAAASAAEEEAEGWGSAAQLAATQGSAALQTLGAAGLAPPSPALSRAGASALVLRSAELPAPQQKPAEAQPAQSGHAAEAAAAAAASAECERLRCRAEQLERQVQEQQLLLDARQKDLEETAAALSAARAAVQSPAALLQERQRQHRRSASLPSDRSLLLQPGEGSDAVVAAADVRVQGGVAARSSSGGSVNQPFPQGAAVPFDSTSAEQQQAEAPRRQHGQEQLERLLPGSHSRGSSCSSASAGCAPPPRHRPSTGWRLSAVQRHPASSWCRPTVSFKRR